ncbi:MAG: hypothetical protein V4620_05685 [Bacteroidota bacterium]
MKKIGIILSLAVLSLLHTNCGSGCGGPDPYPYYNPYPGIQIWLDKSYESDNSMKIKLIEPKAYYYTKSKTQLPLLVNYERMVFEISKQDTILDSLIINYKISSVYVPSNECDKERFDPFVKIDSSYSTGHYFQFSYGAINKNY